MKTYTILIICVVSFWVCVVTGNSLETNANGIQIVNANNSNLIINENEANAASIPTPKVEIEYRAKPGDLKIDTFRNGQLESRSFYRSGLCVKSLIYSIETKELTTEIEFTYKENGELDYQTVIQGKYYDDSEEATLEEKQNEKDFKVQYDNLKSKSIEFPITDLVSDDVSYISNVLSIADTYKIKAETRVDGNRKLIKLPNLNKKIRFSSSTIEGVVGENPILIK